MEVSGPGTEATPQCNLQHSFGNTRSLTHWVDGARDRTCIFVDTSLVRYCWARTGTPRIQILIVIVYSNFCLCFLMLFSLAFISLKKKKSCLWGKTDGVFSTHMDVFHQWKQQHQHAKISAFLYTNNELSEKEIKKTIPFTRASKNNKIIRNKFYPGHERSIHWKL